MTDEILTELLDSLAEHGTHLRQVAARAVRAILDDRRVTVHPQSRESFLAGLRPERESPAHGIDRADEVWRPSRACLRKPASPLFRCAVKIVVEVSKIIGRELRPGLRRSRLPRAESSASNEPAANSEATCGFEPFFAFAAPAVRRRGWVAIANLVSPPPVYPALTHGSRLQYPAPPPPDRAAPPVA
jgi:hypothetical protein